MSYRHFVKKFFGWLKNQRILALFFSGLIIIVALPWTVYLVASVDRTILGVPSGFFVSTLIIPLAVMFFISVYLQIVEDNDRHDPELENE